MPRWTKDHEQRLALFPTRRDGRSVVIESQHFFPCETHDATIRRILLFLRDHEAPPVQMEIALPKLIAIAPTVRRSAVRRFVEHFPATTPIHVVREGTSWWLVDQHDLAAAAVFMGRRTHVALVMTLR